MLKLRRETKELGRWIREKPFSIGERKEAEKHRRGSSTSSQKGQHHFLKCRKVGLLSLLLRERKRTARSRRLSGSDGEDLKSRDAYEDLSSVNLHFEGDKIQLKNN